MHTPVDPATTPLPEGGYSQGVLTTGPRRWLHISGQIPVTREGDVPASFEEQARLVWRNVTETLAAAGMTAANLVKVTTFLSDREHAGTNSAVRREVLGDHRPALTVVLAGIYDPAWLVEIEAVAAD